MILRYVKVKDTLIIMDNNGERRRRPQGKRTYEKNNIHLSDPIVLYSAQHHNYIIIQL